MAESRTHSRSENEASRLVMILLVLAVILPLVFALLMPAGGFFWITVVVLVLLWAFLCRTVRAAAVQIPEMQWCLQKSSRP